MTSEQTRALRKLIREVGVSAVLDALSDYCIDRRSTTVISSPDAYGQFARLNFPDAQVSTE